MVSNLCEWITYRKSVFFSFLFLSMTVMVGCDETKDRKGANSWYNRLEFELFSKEGWEKIDTFFIVPRGRQEEAIRELANRSIIKLTEDDYVYYGGYRSRYDKGNQYLVRSLYYYYNPEGYSIYVKGNSAYIFHTVAGSRRVPRRRRPLVLESQNEIAVLYVSASLYK